VNAPVEFRQLRYFVAVAEELHFGRAAERLHMSQSPLSRTIRELERDLGVVLFVRTTRRVELTSAGSVLLERSRRALAELDGAITDARRSAQADGDALDIGYGPFSETVVTRISDALRTEIPELDVRLEEEVTADSLRRVGAHELAAAVVMETPAASRRHGVRVDALRDEPLLVALPGSHRYAGEGQIPVGAFATECVLLPREPTGRVFNAWLRTVIRAHGLELERTMETLSASWDRRMLPVASGEAVSVLVAEWADDPVPGIVAVPFDPPLSFPIDLASSWPPTESVEALVRAARRVRDAEGWLTQRVARSELPGD
jgi:DNA-binding transcriptional LysR family regulator